MGQASEMGDELLSLLELLVDEAGFLSEGKVSSIIADLPVDTQKRMRMDGVLKALSIETEEAATQMIRFFERPKVGLVSSRLVATVALRLQLHLPQRTAIPNSARLGSAGRRRDEAARGRRRRESADRTCRRGGCDPRAAHVCGGPAAAEPRRAPRGLSLLRTDCSAV
jgi:hypothetical protein